MKETTVLATFKPRRYDSGGSLVHTYYPAIILVSPQSNESRLGLALIHRDSSIAFSWSSSGDHEIVRFYYAAQLLGHCTHIYDDTLCACYYVASSELDNTARHYLRNLEESGISNAARLREEVLKAEINRDFLASIKNKPKLIA